MCNWPRHRPNSLEFAFAVAQRLMWGCSRDLLLSCGHVFSWIGRSRPREIASHDGWGAPRLS
jgi:hypothetical protein